jgi:hypothetical protein
MVTDDVSETRRPFPMAATNKDEPELVPLLVPVLELVLVLWLALELMLALVLALLALFDF